MPNFYLGILQILDMKNASQALQLFRFSYFSYILHSKYELDKNSRYILVLHVLKLKKNSQSLFKKINIIFYVTKGYVTSYIKRTN